MFDFFLASNLATQVFSFKKDSLRFPTPRRIFSAVFILPFFMLLIIVNRIFMMLDWIIFPGFAKMPLKKTCFIIGVPRSATTYLLHVLNKDSEQFTCFKLWEILFAPSVIQKFFLLAIIKFDRLIGRPLYKFSLFIDKIFLGKISTIHETSLSKPEEDEMLLLYEFASMYLAFFFPEVKALDPHLFFDEDISPANRKKRMLFYKRCAQRHMFVFDRKGEKYFLSKNPCFISKTKSIAETFPEAKLLYMLRSPFKTIPSTISLNSNIYSLFSGVKYENALLDKTTASVIRWYQMADDSIKKNWQGRYMTVPFKKITSLPELTVNEIYEFLKINPEKEMSLLLKTEQQKSSSYKSEHNYSSNTNLFDEKIYSNLRFVVEGQYRDEI
jgi:hypothetical protein